MCGIAGFIAREAGSGLADGSALPRMLGRIAHRGPDGSGEWAVTHGNWRVQLGHRRLSIIDLEGGRQPLGNEDGSIQITFNGEIFNFLELRPKLEAEGHRFATRSDTEVLVHHFEQNGADGLHELNGMFAFAIWDGRRGELVLARDRAGIKPLYYASTPDGGIAFASELTSLLEHPQVPRRLDREGLAAYLFSDYALPPASLTEGVRKLEPGHYLVWKSGRLEAARPFWTLDQVTPLYGPTEALDESVLEERLLETLSTSVRRQLVSDVPLGVFLSGGIDSSLIAALASRAMRPDSDPIRTFSIAFEDPSFDESSHARLVARHIGSNHTEETLSTGALLEVCESALSSLDEPMADPSLLPTYLLSRLTARHVKVALGGDGGDELWAGYPTYLAHRLGHVYEALPGFAKRTVIPRLVSALPVQERYQGLEWAAKRFTQRWDDEPFRRHLRWMSSTDSPDLSRALRSPFEPRVPARLGSPLFAEDETNSFLALDFRTYLPGSVLTKVDRASMAHGLEVRPPFLDNESIAFAMGLPSSLKLRQSTSKYLLKRVARRLLPSSIVDRKKKGFGIPLSTWLRGPLRARVEAALRSSPLWESALDRETFSSWNREHQESRVDRSKTLWALVVLDHWMKREKIHA